MPLRFAVDELAELDRLGLRRRLRALDGPQGREVTIDGRRVVNVSSNDYLGLAAHPRLTEASARAVTELGTGAGASRLIVGNQAPHRELELALAGFFGREAALLFNSGYQANVGVLQALAGRGDVVVSDALNHASLIDGCRLSRATIEVVAHGDVAAVEARLAAAGGARRRFVVTDSLFSMDGDRAPLVELAALAQRYDAALIVDEAHAVGVLGDGRGLAAELGVRPDVLVGTLGKAFGSFGAFAVAEEPTVELLLNRARSFVFTTALPPAVVAASVCAVGLVAGDEGAALRSRLARNTARLGAGLRAAKIIQAAETVSAFPDRRGRRPNRDGERGGTARGWVLRPGHPTSDGAGRHRSTPDCRVGRAHRRRHRRAGSGAVGAAGSGHATRREDVDMRQRTRALIELDKRYIWHPFTQMQEWLDETPLVIERGEGNYLIDTEGRRFLDGVSSLWVTVHGHARPEITEAIREQAGCLAHSTLLGLANVPAAELAGRLIELAPRGLSKVFYSDAGSTAVEIALKMAFQYWQLRGKPAKQRFVSLAEAYHGDTIGAVSVGGIDVFHAIFGPLLFEGHRVPTPHPYRASPGDGPEAVPGREPWRAAGDARGARRDHCGRDHGAAGAGRRGHDRPSAGFSGWGRGGLPRARGAANPRRGRHRLWPNRDDVRVRARERVAGPFVSGQGHHGWLSAAGGDPGVPGGLRAFLAPRVEGKTFFHGHTYTGNPLACAAALASPRALRAEGTLSEFARARTSCGLLAVSWAAAVRSAIFAQRGLMWASSSGTTGRPREAYPADWRALGCAGGSRARGHPATAGRRGRAHAAAVDYRRRARAPRGRGRGRDSRRAGVIRWFVTGTDTGVGKTTVGVALLAAAAARGHETAAMKPLESGCARGADGALVPEDALRLAAAATGRASLDDVCPYRFEAPVAPGVAAEAQGVAIDRSVVAAALARVMERSSWGLVEGAGGLLVPLGGGLTIADLVVWTGFPLLIVARPGLGTINHSLLTVEVARARGIEVAGVVLASAAGETDATAAWSNARENQRHGSVPVLGWLGWSADQGARALGAMAVTSLAMDVLAPG